MYRVTQELPFCYGHRLLKHPGKCARLHGHNGVAKVTLSSQGLDAQGMVFDFDELLSSLGAWLLAELDHKLLLERGDPAIAALRDITEPLVELPFAPTAENLARYIFDRARLLGLPVTAVHLVEQPGSEATYVE
ncbi:MAG: 6-carboxytetrahydropterin synthase [Deltaproteobacteria bacterium]|nr:6-carboxytetrahydropterin synthase [Deltaproteobacteria bacterium]